MQVSVLFARFPFGASEHPDGVDWLLRTHAKCLGDKRIAKAEFWRIDDTPITMGRNRCLVEAQKRGFDLVCMLDSDMAPDYPGGKKFWDTSLDFLLNHPGPCCVAAPYCGPPPHENVYVFQWGKKQDGHPNVDMSIDQFTREEAARRGGIEEVAALPTGLFLFDMRALSVLKPPYFTYEWTDEFQTHKASTEDVVFTRNLSLSGIPVYCNWDSWAGHWKRKCVHKPTLLNVDDVRGLYREAVVNGRKSDERLVMIGEGQPPDRLLERQRANGHPSLRDMVVALDAVPRPAETVFTLDDAENITGRIDSCIASK